MLRTCQRNKPPSVPDVMTNDELAVYLQVSKSSLYKLSQEWKALGHKVEQHRRFHREAIVRCLDERKKDKGDE
tara:strand:+ start:399 stop:617 length:219 start_codon:yes stop_codon:yes gene_type:complete